MNWEVDFFMNENGLLEEPFNDFDSCGGKLLSYISNVQFDCCCIRARAL